MGSQGAEGAERAVVVARTAFIVDAFGMIVDGRDGEVDDHGSIVAGGASAGSPWRAAVGVAPPIEPLPDQIATPGVSVDDGSAAMVGRNNVVVRDDDVTASTPTGTVTDRGSMAATDIAMALDRGVDTGFREVVKVSPGSLRLRSAAVPLVSISPNSAIGMP